MPKKGRQATRMTPGYTGPFKGQPQQGTLFDKRALDQQPANVEQTRQRVGPRGYSPARLAEIRSHFNPQISMAKEHFDPEESGWDSRQTYTFRGRGDELSYAHPVHTSDKYLYGVTDINYHDKVAQGEHVGGRGSEGPYQAMDRSMGRAKSKMLETLARSTVPASDLEGLTHIDVKGKEPGKEQWGGYYQSHIGRGQAATQHLPSEQEMIPGVTPREKKSGHIVLSPDPDRMEEGGSSETTLLHELGHHASWLAGNVHSMYNSPHYRAQEEASADRYALQHFRQRTDRTGRKKTQDTWPEGVQHSIDPRGETYGARGNYPKDQMPERGQWSVHMPEYDLPTHMQVPEHLRGASATGRHYLSAESEREQRPMLDEGGSEVFKPEHMGIAKPLDPDRAYKGEAPNREDIYKRNSYTTASGLEQEHKEAAKQWEVRRNVHPALVGQQFNRPSQPRSG